jgi:hypothetical protein
MINRALFLRLACLAFILMLGRALALGATFTIHCESEYQQKSGCVVIMNGEIETGDAAKLRELFARGIPAPGFVNDLVLDSPGGNVAEALRLAAVVRQAMLSTTNSHFHLRKVNRYVCASACFLVWVSGAVRRHITNGKGNPKGPQAGIPYGIALHRPYLSSTAYREIDGQQLATGQAFAAAKVREHLLSEGVPSSLIDQMMKRSSREILWLESSFGIPERAPWYEELLIARCKHDPIQERASRQRALDVLDLALFGKDWDAFERESKKLDQADAGIHEARQRVANCALDELVTPAQRSLQGLK